MEILLLILPFLGICVLMFLIIFSVFIYTLLQIRYKKGSCVKTRYEDMPAYLNEIFKPYQDELSRLGFTLSHCELVDPVFISNGIKNWFCVYLHAEDRIYAELSLTDILDPPILCEINFTSFMNDETILKTFNYLKHAILGELPNTVLKDPYAENLEKHLSNHREYIKQMFPNYPVIIDADRYVEKSDSMLQEYVLKLEKAGLVRKAEDDGYAKTLSSALKIGLRSLKYFFKAQQRKDRKITRLKKQKLPFPMIPAELDARNFMWYKSYTKKRPMNKFVKPVLLISTLVLFIISFSISLSLNIVFLIGAIIFMHELGHFFGIKYFGNKDSNIFFIPFLGAVTTGMKEDAPVSQKLIIYFLGPFPGIVIGTILMLSTGFKNPEDPIFLAGISFLMINYFNLLPVIPLDGGQIFNLLLFLRFPILEVIFYFLSSVILGAMGFLLQAPFFYIFAFLMLTAIYLKLTGVNIIKNIRKKIASENLDISDEQFLVTLIFEELKKNQSLKLNFRQKISIVKDIYYHIKSPPPELKTSIKWMLAYIGVFFFPVIISVLYGLIFYRP